MKVFLSHSSKDKWAARYICRELEQRGITTFLDEKDIKTGESLDATIRAHLTDSDHLLLLLSPASVKSEWVLLELGGALALGKQIIPILLYVGANELPQAISLKLARDINEVEKYFDEVAPAPPKPAARKKRPAAKKKAVTPKAYVTGSMVKIVTNQPQKIYRSEGTNVSWIPRMDAFLGRTAKVIDVDTDGDVTLDIDPNLAWAADWLAPADAT